MIKAYATAGRNGKTFGLLVIGIAETNVNRLKENQPIRIDIAELGLSDEKKIDEIVIIYGPTDQFLVDTFKEFIGPHTEVKNENPEVKL